MAHNWTLRTKLCVLLVVELLYWFGTRLTVQRFPWDSFAAESIRLGLRSASALACWWLLREAIQSKVPQPHALRSVPVILGITTMMAAAFIIPHPELKWDFALLFALGSLMVAINEEILFRGIVFNLLEKRLGFPKSVLVTGLIFTAWHWGVVEHSVWSFTHIFLAGSVITVVYARTGSLLTAIVLHAVYDAVFALPTLNLVSMPRPVAIGLLAYALALVCFKATTAAKRAAGKISASE